MLGGPSTLLGVSDAIRAFAEVTERNISSPNQGRDRGNMAKQDASLLFAEIHAPILV